MRPIGNGVANYDLHEDLILTEPWGDVVDGKFIGRLVLEQDYEKDVNNIAEYDFDVEVLVDDFIDDNIYPDTRKLNEEGSQKAKTMIIDLEAMILKLRAVLPI